MSLLGWDNAVKVRTEPGHENHSRDGSEMLEWAGAVLLQWGGCSNSVVGMVQQYYSGD